VRQGTTREGDEMESGVCVHLLDPIPGVVIARVTDGLRERGHHVELRGDSFSARADRIPADSVLAAWNPHDGMTGLYLTSRPLDTPDGQSVSGVASPEHRAAIVGVPEASGRARFTPELASRVLDLVLRQLSRLSPDG